MGTNTEREPREISPKEANGETEHHRRPGFWQVAGSVAAAAFGVRARKHQEMDFASRSAKPFIIGGLIFTLLFIAGLALIVHLVLRSYNG